MTTTESSPTAIGHRISQLGEFADYCELETGLRFRDHREFHRFSVVDDRFWRLFLDWSGLLHEGSSEPVRTSDECERAAFFPCLALSYVQNLLRIDSRHDGERGALIALSGLGVPARLTRRQLRSRVAGAAGNLRELGVRPGDRVVAVAGNNAEVVIAGLAAVALGASFSSASPEMGVASLLGRFEQLRPSVLMANFISPHGPALPGLAGRIGQLAHALPSLTNVISLDEAPAPQGLPVPVHRLSDLVGRDDDEECFDWPVFPFNHPLFVLFTSGTTGRPKCLVHGAGGTLLEHAKEHRLHVDLRPGERLFFHTSAAWMMWNWQLSALASRAEIVLYDGPISGPQTLWEQVSAERVNVFGTNPAYLQLCQDGGFSPRTRLPLPELRTVLSTGSILHDWQYDWVQEHVGPAALQSISGGTDIIGCFLLGNPDLPIRRGHLQCRSLGLDVQALPLDLAPNGSTPASEPGGEVGQLVCRNPFPSRPLGFFEDDGHAFHAAYFEQNPGVWTHGDLIEFNADGQARMHGRSDGVLQVNGVRVGPAEIYRALSGVDAVREAMAVELRGPGGTTRIVLLVVLHQRESLDARLVVRIRREIARNATPAHVPELVVEVDELPSTHSGKRSERAAQDVVNGRPVVNAEAVSNPESLPQIAQAVATAIQRRRELNMASARDLNRSTEARVRAIWESILGLALEPDDNFFELGGTSLAAVRVLLAIHDQLGVELAPSVFIHAQTTATMAAVIDGPEDGRAPTFVLMRAGTGERPTFIAHDVSGGVLALLPLAMRLQTDRPVYGLQARGLDSRHEPDTRVEEMADSCVQAIRTLQPQGPYTLIGYSFGGLVALEIARRLTALGAQIDLLAMIDAHLDHSCLPARERWRFLIGRPIRYLRLALASPRRRLPGYSRSVVRRALNAVDFDPPGAAPSLPPRLRQVERAGWEALHAYRPRPYEGDAALLIADFTPRYPDPAEIWPRVVRGRVDVERFAGGHIDVVTEPHLKTLAARLSELIAGPPSP